MNHGLVHRIQWGPVEGVADDNAPNGVTSKGRGIGLAKYQTTSAHKTFKKVSLVVDVTGGQNNNR